MIQYAPPITADTALCMLVEGNHRFTNGQSIHPHQNAGRRFELFGGQDPYAVVLTCADSRVSPEIFFDAGIGDLVVIRNMGGCVDDLALASIEYAVEYLDVALVMVVGHTRCGVICAAVDAATGHECGSSAPSVKLDHLDSLVKAIQPAVAVTSEKSGDRLLHATLAHVRNVIEKIQTDSPQLAQRIEQGKLTVVAGLYYIDTGVVDLP